MEQQESSVRGQAVDRRQSAAARSSSWLSQARRFDDSWVEVSSQPTSSSLSSIGDEIITTGLRVGELDGRRHRHRHRSRASASNPPRTQPDDKAMGTNSSQEEYDESDESEDAQATTSSPEQLHALKEEGNDSDADSDDDNVINLGRLSDRPVFRSPPNAFSQQSMGFPERRHSASNAIPRHPHDEFTRPALSQRSYTRAPRSSLSFMSPTSAREDHDAALRASLTTLLSCVAAARGLPKTKHDASKPRGGGTSGARSDEPLELRLVPESDLTKKPHRAPQRARAPSPLTGRGSADHAPRHDGHVGEGAKRNSSAGRSPRATKKKRLAGTVATDDSLASPTLLSWAVSAGVVVLVSVVGFGAGYVIGREVGHQEALSTSLSGVNKTTHCGREVIRSSAGGLRRLRWSDVGRSIAAQV